MPTISFNTYLYDGERKKDHDGCSNDQNVLFTRLAESALGIKFSLQPS
jgi:hypothetical protein